MDESQSCGGAVAGSIFGTIAFVALVAIGAWFFYKKYWKTKSGEFVFLLLIKSVAALFHQKKRNKIMSIESKCNVTKHKKSV